MGNKCCGPVTEQEDVSLVRQSIEEEPEHSDNGKVSSSVSRSSVELDSNADLKLKEVYEKLGLNAGNKMTLTRDPEGSVQSGNNSKNAQGGKPTKLSKRESVFFKPTEKDNKLIEDLLVKVA